MAYFGVINKNPGSQWALLLRRTVRNLILLLGRDVGDTDENRMIFTTFWLVWHKDTINIASTKMKDVLTCETFERY